MSVTSVQQRSTPLDLVLERIGRSNALLAVIAAAYLMIALDVTVVNVALPRIQADLRFSPTDLSWVVNAYLLTFGGLLLLGGRLGDVFGRRRIFVAGVALFTISSVVAGLSPTSTWLVAARAMQGLGGALAAPNTMALLATSFAEGPARNRALSVFSAVAMAGASIGLVVGGVLTTYASWRWALFLNLPIGLAVTALAPRLLDDTERRRARLDVPGAVLSTVAMTSIVSSFIHAGSNGWDALAFGALGGGIALLAVFLLVETRAAQPIVPLHVLRSRRRVGAYASLLLLPGAMYGGFFFLTQFLQEGRGFGPLEAGAAFLPQTMATIVAARLAPRLVARLGPVPVLLTGVTLIGAGIAWLSRIGLDSSYAGSMLVPVILVGLGAGWSVMPLNVTILAGVASAEAGAASAVAQAMQWLGGSLGLAILVTVFGSATRAAAASGATASDERAQLLVDGVSAALSAGVLFAVAVVVVAVVVIRLSQAVPQPRIADPEGDERWIAEA